MAGKKVTLGRMYTGQAVAIDVTDAEMAMHCDDGRRTVRRTTE